jgi:adenosylcobinamide amidohydrolase
VRAAMNSKRPSTTRQSGRKSFRRIDGANGKASSAAPWRAEIRDRTFAVYLPELYRVLGWAPFGGGRVRADLIINHQVEPGARAATEAPRRHLAQLIRAMGRDPRRAVAMMTGAKVQRAATVTLRRGDLIVSAWCTAGCSNALRVGDSATVESVPPGTINLIVAINQALSESAMIEAIQIATEGRVAAVTEARIRSVRSGKPATGTGTDCIVVACRDDLPAHEYCGKHTRLGELIGQAALRSCARALALNRNRVSR